MRNTNMPRTHRIIIYENYPIKAKDFSTKNHKKVDI